MDPISAMRCADWALFCEILARAAALVMATREIKTAMIAPMTQPSNIQRATIILCTQPLDNPLREHRTT